MEKPKINKRQFYNEKTGFSIISEIIPFDIISNEGVHMLDDECNIHIVFWKDLTPEQERIMCDIVMDRFPNEIIAIECFDKYTEYKFRLKYAELL